MGEETMDSKAIIERFLEVATLAGIKGHVDDDGDFAGHFTLHDDRTQMVYARPIDTPEGPGVCVFSQAAAYKKGAFGGISKSAAVELLKRNEKLILARYGLREYEDQLMVVASVDLLIESLDPEELRGAVWSTASAADDWEKEATKADEF